MPPVEYQQGLRANVVPPLRLGDPGMLLKTKFKKKWGHARRDPSSPRSVLLVIVKITDVAPW